MGSTKTTQTNYPMRDPADGDGLHAWIGHDFPQALNNLTYTMPFSGAVQSPGAGGPNDSGWPDGPAIRECAAVSSRESFIPGSIFPIVVHKDATRFYWALNAQSGVTPVEFTYPIDQYGHDVVVDGFRVYLSQEPYRSTIYSSAKTNTAQWGIGHFNTSDGTWMEDVDQPFSTDTLGQFIMSETPTPGTFTGGTVSRIYMESDPSGTDVSGQLGFAQMFNSSLCLLYVSIGYNRHTSDGANLNAGDPTIRAGEKVRLVDFSWWWGFG